MLIPILKMTHLVSDDAQPLPGDSIVRAILATKHSAHVTADEIDALRPHASLDARLVVTAVDWSPGWPRMTYAVEQWAYKAPRAPLTLYRYADDAQGHWWADSAIAARLHGKGFHNSPTLHERTFEPELILARMRTRFGRKISPAEYIVDIT